MAAALLVAGLAALALPVRSSAPAAVARGAVPPWDMSAALGALPVMSAGGEHAGGEHAGGERRRWRQRRRPRRRAEEREEAPSGLVSLAVVHGDASELRRRAEPGAGTGAGAGAGAEGQVGAELRARSDVAYYIELQIGNPPQAVRVQLDTGSFELWVNADCDGLPAAGDAGFCRESRRYDAALSQTAQPEQAGKALRYGIGAANITYVRDDIALPGSGDVVNQMRFGVAQASSQQFSGILGLGFGRGVAVNYNTFMDELARQGLTRTKTCGVGLGAKEAGRGRVTFGGVDTSQFAGRLAALPIIPAARSPDGVPRYWVELRGLAHTGPGAGARPEPVPGGALPVFLDTGATLTLLPPAVVRAVAAALGADVDAPAGRFDGSFYRLPCDLAARDGSLDFAFDGVTVFVPYRELVRQLAQPGRAAPVCYLGLMESDKFSLLGDTFLRSAYVVFDLDRNMTYMARHADCGSTPQPISPTTRLQDVTGRCDEPKLARSRLGGDAAGDGRREDGAGAGAASGSGSGSGSGPVRGAASLRAVVGAAAACALVAALV